MLQITRLSENLLSLINIAENDKVSIVGGDNDCKNKTVKWSPSKKSNKATSFFTPNARENFYTIKASVY